MLTRNFTKFLFLHFLLPTLFIGSLPAQEINEIIEPVNLISGKTDSVLISDMFYANNYSGLKLNNNNPNVGIKFNFDKTKFIFATKPGTEGLLLINFNFEKKPYVIPVRVVEQQMISFKFKPLKKYSIRFFFSEALIAGIDLTFR